jgi:hypothetical protein
MILDRRRFLQLTAAGVVASLAESGCTGDAGEDAQSLAHPALIEMFGPERAREIGTQYRARMPKENTAAALRAAISNSRHKAFPWTGHRSIEDQIRDDFADGRTIVVSGWVLSETEARQCALYSLSA